MIKLSQIESSEFKFDQAKLSTFDYTQIKLKRIKYNWVSSVIEYQVSLSKSLILYIIIAYLINKPQY